MTNRLWGWFLLLSVTVVIAIVVITSHPTDLPPFFWAPVLIAASLFTWPMVLALAGTALCLSVIVGWAAEELATADFWGRTALRVMISLFAVMSAWQIQKRDERLLAMSFTDSLTNLPNRARLYDRLNFRLKQRIYQGPTTVIFLDLDNFKQVNDDFGHDIGDAMLKEVAHRLTEVVRNEDTVARLGGDEFVIMCTSISDSTGAEILCERLSSAVREPFDLNGHQIVGGGSIGCVVFDQDDADAQQLVNLADGALREAKKNNKGGHHLLDLSKTQV